MARITVEDCLERVDNRFQLVLIAARRARDLALGRPALVPSENDKPTVIALRELAEGKLDTLIREKYGRFSLPEPAPEITRDASLEEASLDEGVANTSTEASTDIEAAAETEASVVQDAAVEPMDEARGTSPPEPD